MKMSLQALLAGAAAALTGLAIVVVMPMGAHATTYQLDFVPTQGIVTPFGTVDITGGGSSLTYTFNLTSGGQFHATGNSTGLDTLVFDVNGTITGSSFTSSSGFALGTLDTSPNADGLGSFTDGFFCTDPGGGGQCGTNFSVTFTGSNLSAGFTTTSGVEIFAGADITCVFTGASTCSNDRSFNTGEVGATPLPGALALFLGPMMLGGGYLLRRRRRTTTAAA